MEWIVILSYGIEVKDEYGHTDNRWKLKSGITLYDRYSCKRTIKVNDDTFFIITKFLNPIVWENHSFSPLSLVIKNVPRQNFTSLVTLALIVTKKVLEKLGVTVKGQLNGSRFFGFTLKYYFERLSCATTSELTSANIDYEKCSTNFEPSVARQCNWALIHTEDQLMNRITLK